MKTFTRSCWVLLVLSVVTPAAQGQVATTPAPDVAAGIQVLLEEWHERGDSPGATVGFVLPGGESGSVSVGVANVERAEAMTGAHRMMAGSTGKTFFAALALQLVAEGRIDLDAPISTWLGADEWFPRLPNAERITFRMLLQHTSGIPRYVMLPAFVEAMRQTPDRRWDPVEILAFVFDAEPACVAGEGWSYADTNFVVAALIIERVTDDSCYNQIHDRFLRPRQLWDVVPTTSRDVVGLADGYVDPDQNLLGLTEADVLDDGRYVFNPQFEWAGGGYATTPRDLARWAALLYGGDLLSAEMKQVMRDGVPARLGPRARYGLGAMLRPSMSGDVIGHAGYFPGYLTDVAYYGEHGVALAVQVNTTKMSPAVNPRTLQGLLDDCAAVIIAATNAGIGD